MWGAIPGPRVEDLSDKWGEELLSLEKENSSDFEKQSTNGKELNNATDYCRRLESFETAYNVFAIPMEVKRVWSRTRLLLTSWLYFLTKIHMKEHEKEYRQFLAEIGPEAFKRPQLIHRNRLTTGWKQAGKASRDNTITRQSILEEDLAKNVSLSLHHSFCLNREPKVKKLPNHPKRLQKQKEWMRAYEQLRAWEEVVISSNIEEELTKQNTVSSASEPSTSEARGTNEVGYSAWILES